MAQREFIARTEFGDLHGVDTGDGPTLLLLHGGPGLTDYMGMLEPETGGFRAIRYQQRGNAPSTLDGPFSIHRHVADAIAVLDALEVDRAIVGGHSWGGHLALQIGIAHPGRVSGLLLLDPPGSVGDGGLVDAALALNQRLLPTARPRAEELDAWFETHAPTDETATEALALRWPGYYAEPLTAPSFPPGLTVATACNQATIGSMFEGQADGAFATALTAMRIPVVFVVGAKSPIPHRYAQATAASMPDAEVMLIAEGGHLPWHEQPNCVAVALNRLRERSLTG
jgi:proline iminopeptidase